MVRGLRCAGVVALGRTLANWLLLGLAGVLALPCPARANGLVDAYRAALANDAGLASAREARDAAIEAHPQARAALLPQLDVAASVTREHDVLDSGSVVVDGTSARPPAADVSVDATVTSYGARLRQTLWDVEAFQRLCQSDLEVAAAEVRYRDAQQALILRVATSYFAVLAAADTLSANRGERDAYGALVELAKKRFETGLGARIAVEEAQSFHSLTEQSVIDGELALSDAFRALVEITARAEAPVAPLAETIALAPPDPLAAEPWLGAARADNFAVAAADLAAQAAERGAAAVRGRYWPVVALEGDVSQFHQPLQTGGDERAASVGVALAWPLFEGGRVASQAREADARFRQARADLDARRRAVERDTLAAFRAVVGGIHRIEANRRAVEANRTAVEASRNGVVVGTRTEFDLLNAQNNFYAALRAYFQSRYEYLTQSLTLRAQAGRLGEDDLAAIDAQLVAGGPSVMESLPAELR